MCDTTNPKACTWNGEINVNDFTASVKIMYEYESKNTVSNWSGVLVCDNHLETMDVLDTNVGKNMLAAVNFEDDYYFACFIG